MCFPINPATLSTLGTVTSVVGTVQAARAQSAAADYQSKINERNAQMARQQAEQIGEAGWNEQRQHMRKVAALRSTQRNELAGRGLDITMGSPLDILSDTAYMGAQDAATIGYNTALKKYAALNEANNYTAQAGLNRAAAANSRSVGMIGAAGDLLNGMYTLNEYWYKKPKQKNALDSLAGGG